MLLTDTNPWYYKYTGLPYLHLGNDPSTGIDCFNLCRLVLKEEANMKIPLTTSDFCNIVDEDWYLKTTIPLFENGTKIENDDFKCIKVEKPKLYDIIFMSLGSTNVTNHCAIYVDTNKILHTMIDHNSWIAPYGKYYKQYTTGIYRWTA